MDDRTMVQRFECGQDRKRRRDRLAGWEWPSIEAIGERLPFEQLHRQERRPFVLADFEELTDVRMVDGGRGTRFAQQAIVKMEIR